MIENQERHDTNTKKIEQDMICIDNTDNVANLYQEINTKKVDREIDAHVQPKVYRLDKEVDTDIQPDEQVIRLY